MSFAFRADYLSLRLGRFRAYPACFIESNVAESDTEELRDEMTRES